MSKRDDTDALILTHFEAFADDEDRSTIAVIQMTADASHVSYGRVVDALQRHAERRGAVSSS